MPFKPDPRPQVTELALQPDGFRVKDIGDSVLVCRVIVLRAMPLYSSFSKSMPMIHPPSPVLAYRYIRAEAAKPLRNGTSSRAGKSSSEDCSTIGQQVIQ
jgi:hypothetical protein